MFLDKNIFQNDEYTLKKMAVVTKKCFFKKYNKYLLPFQTPFGSEKKWKRLDGSWCYKFRPNILIYVIYLQIEPYEKMHLYSFLFGKFIIQGGDRNCRPLLHSDVGGGDSSGHEIYLEFEKYSPWGGSDAPIFLVF